MCAQQARCPFGVALVSAPAERTARAEPAQLGAQAQKASYPNSNSEPDRTLQSRDFGQSMDVRLFPKVAFPLRLQNYARHKLLVPNCKSFSRMLFCKGRSPRRGHARQ